MALVDTGATTSAVTAEIAKKLNLPFIGKRMIASAHGDQPVDRISSEWALSQPRDAESNA